jgi:hypothetical protein
LGYQWQARLFMASISLTGIISPGAYGKETLNWKAQAIGQNYVNLCVAFSVLIIPSLSVLRRDFPGAFHFKNQKRRKRHG